MCHLMDTLLAQSQAEPAPTHAPADIDKPRRSGWTAGRPKRARQIHLDPSNSAALQVHQALFPPSLRQAPRAVLVGPQTLKEQHRRSPAVRSATFQTFAIKSEQLVGAQKLLRVAFIVLP